MTYTVYPASVVFVDNATDELLARSTEGPGAFIVRVPEYVGPPPPSPGCVPMSWQNKCPSRAINTPYVNDEDVEITVSVGLYSTMEANVEILVDDGSGWVVAACNMTVKIGAVAGVSARVPAGASYKATVDVGSGGVHRWAEYRPV